jgi:TRAP-type uncharacterized transport system fused permease subunit
MDTVFGLPTHPLAVHGPVVLLPLVALATVVLAVRERWRSRAGWWPVVAVAVVVVLLFVARRSGQELDEALAGAVDVSVHRRLADQTLLLGLLWLVLAAILVLVDHRRDRPPARPVSAAVGGPERSLVVGSRVLAGVTAAVAVAAMIWLIRTGHEGAYPTWRPTVDLYFDGG